MLDRYGERAAKEATLRSQELFDSGEDEAARFWEEVAEFLSKMLCDKSL